MSLSAQEYVILGVFETRTELSSSELAHRAIERTALAGLSRDDERAVRRWLAGIAAMAASTGENHVAGKSAVRTRS
jgi:hypothetical protein